MIANYESIKNSKYYPSNSSISICPYIQKIQLEDNNGIDFKLKLPNNAILIFDEAYKCKKYRWKDGSINSILLCSTRKTNMPTILSKTLFDKSKFFISFGYVLKFFDSIVDSKNWLDMLKVNEQEEIEIINALLVPKYSSRIITPID